MNLPLYGIEPLPFFTLLCDLIDSVPLHIKSGLYLSNFYYHH